jgi:hypothetical protein
MAHVKLLVGGVPRLESDIIYLRKRASEERTAALHVLDSDVRKKHLDQARQYEDRVRAIAMRDKERATSAVVGTPSVIND